MDFGSQRRGNRMLVRWVGRTDASFHLGLQRGCHWPGSSTWLRNATPQQSTSDMDARVGELHVNVFVVFVFGFHGVNTQPFIPVHSKGIVEHRGGIGRPTHETFVALRRFWLVAASSPAPTSISTVALASALPMGRPNDDGLPEECSHPLTRHPLRRTFVRPVVARGKDL